MTDISNTDDVIDSRDVIARIEELERQNAASDDDPDNVYALDADEMQELTALKALAEEASGSPDWTFGETLIRDSYFKEYAKQLADDVGAINADAAWPNNCIDWDRAASELQHDYSAVDFDGVTYWIRS